MKSSDPSNPSSDRREAPRIDVEIWAEERAGTGVYYHRVTNLSRNGFFIEKKLPFPVEAVVDVRLELPGTGERVTLRGRVVDNYVNPDANFRGAGVSFLEMDADTRRKIDLCIRHLASGSNVDAP